MNMEKEHKEKGNPNWILIYVMCPILVILSVAAIIYIFKELPKISVLREKFDRHEEQIQNKLEYLDKELKEIKNVIVKLAEKNGKLDADLVKDLMTQIDKMQKDGNFYSNESEILNLLKGYSKEKSEEENVIANIREKALPRNSPRNKQLRGEE